MKKNIVNYRVARPILVCIACACLTACSNETNDEQTSAVEVQFASQLTDFDLYQTTRVTADNKWESSDEVLIGMMPAGNGDIRNVNFLPYIAKTSGSSSNTTKLLPSVDHHFFPKEGSVDFIAYYPTRFNASNGEFAVDATKDGDLIYAKTLNKAKEAPEVTLKFEHVFCKMVVKLQATPDMKESLLNAQLEIIGLTKDGVMNLMSGHIEPVVNVTTPLRRTINIGSNPTNGTSIIMTPTDPVAGATATLTLASGSTFTWDMSTIKFDRNTEYICTLVLNAKKEVGVTGEIVPWTPGKEETSNLYQN